MKKCVIASDSFKGTLSSKQIADLFEIEFKKAFPLAKLEKVVLGDGGENTLSVFSNHFTQGQYHVVEVTGPNFKKVNARYFAYNDIAVIELAEAAGLSLIDIKDVMSTTTYGVGELISDAYSKGYRKFYVALGGSATNDGGCGLLAALGVRFINKDGESFVPTGGTLCNISNIDISKFNYKDAHFTILSDVNNVMYGSTGAAYVFASQKGASSEETKFLDENLKYLNSLFVKTTGKDVSNISGTGAAGAVSAGMLAFLNCEIVSGIDTILNLIKFDSIIKDADYVITGEGRLDSQSFNGKLISGVLKKTTKQNIKTICICGRSELKTIPSNTFYKVIETSPEQISPEQIRINASNFYSNSVKTLLQNLK